MGLDAVIEIRGIRNAQALDELNVRIGSVLNNQTMSDPYGNYFEFDEADSARFKTMWRYWGPEYERGPWFEIAGVLMAAMAITGLEVLYGSDSEEPTPMTADRMIEYWNHFCGPNGDDYRKSFRAASTLMMTYRGGFNG